MTFSHLPDFGGNLLKQSQANAKAKPPYQQGASVDTAASLTQLISLFYLAVTIPSIIPVTVITIHPAAGGAAFVLI